MGQPDGGNTSFSNAENGRFYTVEKWAYFKQNCRRILVRFEWTNENKNFKLISMDVNGRIIGGED